MSPGDLGGGHCLCTAAAIPASGFELLALRCRSPLLFRYGKSSTRRQAVWSPSHGNAMTLPRDFAGVVPPTSSFDFLAWGPPLWTADQ